MEAKADTMNLNHLQLPISSEDAVRCPSCDVKLKTFEVAQHCEQETERLRQMQMRAMGEAAAEAKEIAEKETSKLRGKPWSVFQRVQRNRQTRLRQRSRKRPNEVSCPVCNAKFSQDEIQRHTEECLRLSASSTNGINDGTSDDEVGEDEYEEYEWAGQKRIRASSFLRGGYASLGIGQSSAHQQDEEDEDLNVDEDDTHIYGPAQYGEGDVIPPTLEPNSTENSGDMSSYVRQLITGNSNALNTTSTPSQSNSDNEITGANCIPSTENSSIPKAHSISSGAAPRSVQHYQQIIDSLTAKLKHYENHVQSKFKCLICLDDYRNPAISVSCWHVHCEECWLRSLGARKLCPQCNLITTPKDLRRIYM